MNKDINLEISSRDLPANNEGFFYNQSNIGSGVGEEMFGNSTITNYGTFYRVNNNYEIDDIFFILNREYQAATWTTPYYKDGTTNIIFAARVQYRYFSSGNFAIYFPYNSFTDTIKNKINSLLTGKKINFYYTFNT